MKRLARISEVPIILSILLCACVLALPTTQTGCAMFSPVASLAPEVRRTNQLAAAEEQLNNATNAVTTMYVTDKTITAEQYMQAATIDRNARLALSLARTANQNNDLSTFDGQLKTVRDLINELLLTKNTLKVKG